MQELHWDKDQKLLWQGERGKGVQQPLVEILIYWIQRMLIIKKHGMNDGEAHLKDVTFLYKELLHGTNQAFSNKPITF
jgi:hypothetical protein